MISAVLRGTNLEFWSKLLSSFVLTALQLQQTRTDIEIFSVPLKSFYTKCAEALSLSPTRFNFEDETPTTNFDSFPAAIMTVFQVYVI